MRLTVYTDLSFRALMFLALWGDGLATGTAIAKAYGISDNHLMELAILAPVRRITSPSTMSSDRRVRRSSRTAALRPTRRSSTCSACSLAYSVVNPAIVEQSNGSHRPRWGVER
jgi:hypothetical protein